MILTQSQLALENSLRRILPADIVSLWIPDGYNRAKDIIRSNHGQCYGTHPNVPVISTYGPNILTDGGLNLWTTETNLTHWTEYIPGGSTVNREATEKVEGDFSCKLEMDAIPSVANINQSFSLIPLKRYKLIVWYKNSLAAKNVQIVFRDTGSNVRLASDGTWGAVGITFPNSLVWTSFEVEFSGHADYSDYILIFTSSSTSFSTYFDNISIEELKPSLINTSVGWVFGGDDLIEMPYDKSMDITGEMTAGAWVNPAAPPIGLGRVVLNRRIYNADPALIRGWYLGYKHGSGDEFSLEVLDASGNLSTAKKTSFFAENLHKWTYVVGVFKPSQYVYLYVNKVKVAEDTTDVIAAIAYAFKTSLRVGGKHDIGQGLWDGNIVLPFLAKGIWSQQQVNNFGNATKSLFSPRGF